jgi:hypothetical protein
MQGVYLVAAELSRLGYIASPTSRSARAADLLVTDQACKRAHSVQVKTNSSKSSYWLLGKDAKELRSPSHVYVFVAIRPKAPLVSFFVVPSEFVAKHTYEERFGEGTWYSFTFADAAPFENQWLQHFGPPYAEEPSPEG